MALQSDKEAHSTTDMDSDDCGIEDMQIEEEEHHHNRINDEFGNLFEDCDNNFMWN